MLRSIGNTLSTDLYSSRVEQRILEFVPIKTARGRSPVEQTIDFPSDNRPPSGSRSRRVSRADAGARMASRCRLSLVSHKQLTTYKTWGGAVSTRPITAEGDHHSRSRDDFHATRFAFGGRRVARVATLAHFLEAWPWTVRPMGAKVGVSVSERRTIPGTQEMSQGLRGRAEQALATLKRLGGYNLQHTRRGRPEGPGRTSAGPPPWPEYLAHFSEHSPTSKIGMRIGRSSSHDVADGAATTKQFPSKRGIVAVRKLRMRRQVVPILRCD